MSNSTIELVHHRFNVKQYHEMYTSGILTDCDRTELIHGDLLTMSPINRRHAACVNRLTYLLSCLGKRAIVAVQNPIHLSDDSEPQPDVAILKWQDDFYAKGHPIPSDILWLIEVSDTTIGVDRRIKVPLYTESGIVETWLINLNDDCIEVYRQGEGLILHRGDQIASLAFPDVLFEVAEILG